MTHSRFFYQLTPEYGTGYYLGIVGGSLMLLLLAYPLKKRARRAPLPFSARFWFRTHMQLGIVGPALIVLHSKLNLGSTNSTVAFVFMMTVMVSGLIGRFLYQKVHVSLYGRRRDLGRLLEELKQRIDERVTAGLAVPGSILNLASDNDQGAIDESLSGLRTMRRELRAPGNLAPGNATRRTAGSEHGEEEYLAWLRRIDGQLAQCISLMTYERLFSWWHYLHIPIFFAFVLATVVHIVAVHLY